VTRPIVEIVSGDIVTLTFVAMEKASPNAAATAINIATATDVDVQIFAVDEEGLPDGAAVVSENIAGDIALVGGGTGGQFSLDLVAADTASLEGDYWLEARIEDASNRFRTLSPVTLRIKGDLITS